MRPEAYVKYDQEKGRWVAEYHNRKEWFGFREDAVSYVEDLQSKEISYSCQPEI